MPGPRENLFAAVAAKLESIRQDNGYDNDVGAVFRTDLLFDQINDGEFPALEVLEPLAAESMTPVDSGGYLCRLSMTIAGLVKTGGVDLRTAERHTAVNSLLNDTISALMQDVRFGGKCKESAL